MGHEMIVNGPTNVLPLRRIRAGCWRTRDGLWDIVADPTDWRELGIGGLETPRRAWYVYPTDKMHPSTVSTAHPVFIAGTRAWGRLRDAVEVLLTARTVNVEPTC